MISRRCLYVIYAFIFVALVMAVTMTVIFVKPKSDTLPSTKKITQQGTLLIYPQMDTVDEKEPKPFQDSVDKILEVYLQAQPRGVSCERGVIADKNHSCIFDLSLLGNCSEPKSGYGYYQGSPCFYLVLKETGSWYPEEAVKPHWKSNHSPNHIPVTCELSLFSYGGKEQTKRMHSKETLPVWPAKGFPRYFFPEEGTPDFRPPLVAVQMTQIWKKLPSGGCGTLSCKVVGGNVDNLVTKTATMQFSTMKGMSCTTDYETTPEPGENKSFSSTVSPTEVIDINQINNEESTTGSSFYTTFPTEEDTDEEMPTTSLSEPENFVSESNLSTEGENETFSSSLSPTDDMIDINRINSEESTTEPRFSTTFLTEKDFDEEMSTTLLSEPDNSTNESNFSAGETEIFSSTISPTDDKTDITQIDEESTTDSSIYTTLTTEDNDEEKSTTSLPDPDTSTSESNFSTEGEIEIFFSSSSHTADKAEFIQLINEESTTESSFYTTLATENTSQDSVTFSSSSNDNEEQIIQITSELSVAESNFSSTLAITEKTVEELTATTLPVPDFTSDLSTSQESVTNDSLMISMPDFHGAMKSTTENMFELQPSTITGAQSNTTTDVPVESTSESTTYFPDSSETTESSSTAATSSIEEDTNSMYYSTGTGSGPEENTNSTYYSTGTGSDLVN